MKKVTYLFILFLGIASTGCQEEKGFLFQDVTRISFSPKEAGNYEMTYSFIWGTQNRDTVYLPVSISGRTADHDRQIEVVQIPGYDVTYNYDDQGYLTDSIITEWSNSAVAGKHYIAFDDAEAKALLKIKAGEITGYVPVIVLRNTSLKTEKVRLRIQLVASNDLELGQAKNLIMLLNISDQLEQPVNWTRYSSVQSYLGAYSKPKHELMIEVLHDKVDENWLEQMANDRPNLIFWRGKFQEALNAFNNDLVNIASGKAPLREDPNDSNSAEVTFPSNV